MTTERGALAHEIATVPRGRAWEDGSDGEGVGARGLQKSGLSFSFRAAGSC